MLSNAYTGTEKRVFPNTVKYLNSTRYRGNRPKWNPQLFPQTRAFNFLSRKISFHKQNALKAAIIALVAAVSASNKFHSQPLELLFLVVLSLFAG